MSRTVKYLFEFKDSPSWSYELNFDKQHALIPKPNPQIKPWTALEFHKCQHCPLNSSSHPQCPVARNIDHIVDDSKATLSIKEVRVTVITPEREYAINTSTQKGLLSLFGLIMATSGCPHLDWLRPLARFHLPFASIEETLFRVLSLQLLTEFFERERKGEQSAVSLIKEKYKAVETVNHTFIRRIRSYCSGDADKNALAALDMFVQLFTLHEENDFSAIRAIFEQQSQP